MRGHSAINHEDRTHLTGFLEHDAGELSDLSGSKSRIHYPSLRRMLLALSNKYPLSEDGRERILRQQWLPVIH